MLNFYQNPSLTTESCTIVSCVKWSLKGYSDDKNLASGQLAGFETNFEGSTEHLSSLYIGLTGNHRFKVIKWLMERANKLGLDQHVTEVKIKLKHTYRDRINGTDENGCATNEYDLIKATSSLKDQITSAWSSVVTDNQCFDEEEKNKLLTVALTGNINKFIPISSVLFAKTVEKMHSEFKNASAIFFPAFPIEQDDWKDNPAKLVAFSKDVIVDVKYSGADMCACH
jgi:hypothetical protein